MQKNKHSEFIGQYLKDAMETPPFSFVLAGNITKIFRENLLEEQIRDFPVIALTGSPGSGKTSVARACMRGNVPEFLFTDRVSSVKKQLLKPELQDGYVLLDDCADFASQTARQKAQTYLDEVVRGSYNGTTPLMVITVEEKALEHITRSCRMRLLEIPVADVLKNPSLRAILDYLQQNGKALDRVFSEFERWFLGNCAQYDFQQRLRKFREKYKERDSRSASLFFIYFTALEIFNDFLEDCHGMEISMKKIEENYLEIWEKRTNSTLSRKELVKKLFQSLLEGGAFMPIAPRPEEMCIAFCKGFCTNRDEWGKPDCEECTCYNTGNFYNPLDLFLGSDDSSAILLEAGRYLYQFPKYCDSDSPLLIVRDSKLLALMNSELHKLCCGQKINIHWFGPKELHQLLFEANMCFYRFISNEHKTFVFQYESLSNEKESVMVLRLTESQFELLSEIATSPVGFGCSSQRLKKFCRKLKELGSSIHGMAGE